MTSLIAATLVEGGKLSWSSTVSEVFSELTANMDQAVRGVTLEQLLSNASGIPSDTEAHEKLIRASFARPPSLDAPASAILVKADPRQVANDGDPAAR